MAENESNPIEQDIVVTVDDCKNLKNYGEYFGVSLDKALVKALDDFIEDQSFLNQQNILREFCVWITTHPHETFKDPLWEKPQLNANKFLPELLLDHEIDKLIQGKSDVDPENASAQSIETK